MPEAVISPKVSVLIVGYKAKDLVSDCLRTLYAYTTGIDFEVVFVDCSDDGSSAMLARDFSQVRVIENHENLGFGRGNNFVARHAKGEYLLLLNPDTLLRDNAIGELMSFAENCSDFGACGGVTELPDGRVDPGCQQTGPGLRFALYRLLGLKSLGTGGLSAESVDPGDVPVLTGAFMLIRRDRWEQLGGFDESFFMYCEETDLCLRIRHAGYRVVMVPKARITHLVGGGAADNPRRMLAMCKGAMHMDRKHFGSMHVLCEGLLRWTHSLTRYLGGVVFSPLRPGKASVLREKHRSIVFQPKQWWGGWGEHVTRSQGRTSAAISADSSMAKQGGGV